MVCIRLIVETGVDKNSLYNGKTPLDVAGLFRSYTFYKSLSNDKTQLYGSIFVCLMYIVVINFFICLSVFVFELILFSLLSCWIQSECVKNKLFYIFCEIAIAALVNWVITVLLTFTILLKRGLVMVSLDFVW